MLRILFFGSTEDSVAVINELYQKPLITPFGNVELCGIVTRPPAKIGRKQIITPTPVELWATKRKIRVFSFDYKQEKPWLFADETMVALKLQALHPDLILSASFGQKIPTEVFVNARFGGLNIHPSLLPRWRGADPVPWSILAGDKQTGVSVCTLSDQFDQGQIVVQKKISLPDYALPDPLRSKLFSLGSKLLVNYLTTLKDGTFKGVNQDIRNATYARRLSRQDGFMPWTLLAASLSPKTQALSDTLPAVSNTLPVVSWLHKYNSFKLNQNNLPEFLERMVRAFTPWPGMWTIIRTPSVESRVLEEKRLKILKTHITNPEALSPASPARFADVSVRRAGGSKLDIDIVQIEGKNPVSWSQFSSVYLKNLNLNS